MKMTSLRALAWVITLVMVLGMLPTGLLSFTAAATGTAVTEKTIYVDGTNGSDSNDGRTENTAFKTIQAAVNAVDENNTIPTTILIADGAYNVYVPKGSDNSARSANHNLLIAKSNLTLKAQNEQKVVIYGFASEITDAHNDGSVLHVKYCENVTLDGLVILPHFVTTMPSVSNMPASAETVNARINGIFGTSVDYFPDATTLYQHSGNPLVRTGEYARVPSNGSVTTNSGLTFKNCYFDTMQDNIYAFKLDSCTTGDYHFVGNTLTGKISVTAAGNSAKVQSEFRNNTFIGNRISITLTGAIEKLPVIEGNTFEGPWNNTLEVISTSGLSGNLKYTAGELSVMCQTNTLNQTGGSGYGTYLYPNNNGVTVVDSAAKVDLTIDTEEELAYWMTQAGDCTLAADITVTKDILPETVTATLNFGGFTVTKTAGLDISAPAGYVWNNDKLYAHTCVAGTAWESDGDYHWHGCTAEVADGIACTEQLNKAEHTLATDDGNCETPDECKICLWKSGTLTHSFDGDCTTADVCGNSGCAVKDEAATFHTFDDNSDTTCNVAGCAYTREAIEGKIIYVATTGDDTNGDGSKASPYKTIQKAVNTVPAGNTIPTTILIADGAYNEYVVSDGDTDISKGNGYGQTLVICKSNLTLKAQNSRKVVIYAYSDPSTNTYYHHNNSALTIKHSANLTFEGLVILPHFTASIPSDTWHSASAATCNALVRSFLGEDTADLFVGDTNGKLYFNNNQAMIRTEGYAAGISNSGVATVSGLTFKDCYFDGTVNTGAISLDSAQVVGDYHFIGNTFAGKLVINGAGNSAKVDNEIIGNTFVRTNSTTREILIKGATSKLPVIEGNTFMALTGDAIVAGNDLIANQSTAAQYTAGELSVMCQKNDLVQGKDGAAPNIGVSTYVTTYQKIQAQNGAEDKTIDTEEELVYWLEQGDVTMNANVVITQDILPAVLPNTLTMGSYTVTKDAELDIDAPAGYTWLYGKTLTKHDHSFVTTKWEKDINSHWYACATEGCYVKNSEAGHNYTDDYDCTTSEFCNICSWETTKQDSHNFDDDGDCTTADPCQNEGCLVKTEKVNFHTFDNRKDTTCNACDYVRQLPKENVIYVATNGSDELGDGSLESPFASIQRAVNEVPANNTTPTTILIADGAYNVHLDKNNSMKLYTDGSNLTIARSNLTLKAVNAGKVVIYGYADEMAHPHKDGSVLRIDNCENLTFEGLVILPHFVNTPTAKSGTALTPVEAAQWNTLVKSILGDEIGDIFTQDTVYQFAGQATIRTDNYATTPTNGTVTTVSGLTFQNCDLYSGKCTNIINMQSSNVTGDYHFIGNRIYGSLTVNGAGNAAEVDSEIIGNTFITATNDPKQIVIRGTVTKLPVIIDNTFKATTTNINATKVVIHNMSTADFTAGELSVMCQTNYVDNTNEYDYLLVQSAGSGAQKIAVCAKSVTDTAIDTEEELAYWLEQGDATLSGDIKLTGALPESMTGALTLNGHTVTKSADLESPAPEGYCWVNGTTLTAHSWSSVPTPNNPGGVSTCHYIYCTNCLAIDDTTGENCTPEIVPDGVSDCTVAIHCTVCNGITTAATSHSLSAPVYKDESTHTYSCANCDQIIEKAHTAVSDGNCLTADVCACGYTVVEARTAHSHTKIKRDANGHWYQCQWCESTTEVEAHTGGTATCSMPATCEICLKAYGEVNAENHCFTNYISDGSAPCTANGTKTAVCDWCATATDTVTDEDAVRTHSFEGQPWKPGEAGHYMECVNFANCGAVSEEVAHSGGAATCSVRANCELCGAAYGELAADVHSFTDYISDGNATCSADGTKTAKCDYCGVATDTVTDSGSILTHSFTNFVSDGNATCQADGTKTAVCDNGCGATKTEADPGSVTGHNFDGKQWVSTKVGHWVRCACGEKSLYEHTPVVSGAKEATTTETGYTGDTACEVCGYQIARGEIIAKLPAPASEGLSTGAIVAIVVGSVAAIGLIGFAGYWFLIKKKP